MKGQDILLDEFGTGAFSLCVVEGMDEKDIPSLAYWLKDEELVSEYGKFWRCWPRKPTPEQMAAEKWEE